jgi:8-oxo-dGTP pyrophosphatase MutT (NUDIX family)
VRASADEERIGGEGYLTVMLRFFVTRSMGPVAFWATPGGEIEDGESDYLAAQRELREELGIVVDLTGPVRTATAQFLSRTKATAR